MQRINAFSLLDVFDTIEIFTDGSLRSAILH